MRRGVILTVSYLCGLAVAAGGFAARSVMVRHRAEDEREAVQAQALCDAVGYLEAMADSLDVAVDGEMPLPALAELRHHADLASAALGNVAFSGEGGEALRRFAACTAEIAGGMVDALARGQVRTPDYALLSRLCEFARPLRDGLLEEAITPATAEVDEMILSEHFAGLGRLYYDGVGSDVQPPGGYTELLGGVRLDEAEARQTALKIAGETARLRALPTAGEPERYCFSCTNLSVTLSARGGVLLSLLYDRKSSGEGENIGEAAAREAAGSALGAYGPGGNFAETEMTEGEGCYYFCFAPQREGVLCLSERILVGIDAASGKLSLWDADRYYRYHTAVRTLPEGLLDPEAAAVLAGRTEHALLCTAVRSDGRELLCYRVGAGEQAVYVNAQTGRVERVEK